MITHTNKQITTYRILDATIKAADIDTDAVITAKIIDDAVTTPKILDAAVTGAKLPDDAVGYFETAAETVVAFTDFGASPIQLLGLDASNDRLVMVQAIATIDAADGPEWDVGSETLDTQAVFADIGGGVWVAGERWTGFCLLPANQKLECTLTTAGSAGAIKFRVVVMIPKVQTAQIAADAITTTEILDGAVTSAKWANGAGVAALIAAGLGASAAYPKETNGVQTLMVADGANTRAVLIIVVVTETFVNNGGSQTTFKIGETDSDDKFAAVALFTGATVNDIHVLAGSLTIAKALLVTAVQFTPNGTGAISVTAIALNIT